MKKIKVGFISCISALLVLAVGLAVGFTRSPSVGANADTIKAYYIDGSTNSTVEYTECSAATGGYGLVASLTKPTDKLVLREVIDLKNKSSNDVLLGLKVLPKKTGTADITGINVSFVDVYDESNYVMVNFTPYPGQPASNSSYSLAYASNGQQPTGHERSDERIRVNEWGLWTYFCFVNTNYTYQLSYDYEENQLFVIEDSGLKFIIADFDDPDYFGSNTWKGFTTGEVYCKINLIGLQSDSGSLLIDSYAGFDLSKGTITDEKGPVLEIDFGDYTEGDLPCAVVGYKYPLFNSWAYDLYSGEEDVSVKVYMNYYSSSPIELFVRKDLTFTPTFAGVYYAVYEATDGQGNKTTHIIEIEAMVNDDIEPLAITLSDHASTCVVGESYALPEATVSGNVGNGTLTVKAVNEGKTISIEKNSARPVQVGTMAITYTATDYVGRNAEKVIEVEVTATNKATFIEKPVLPKYFVEGNSYKLPIINAYNFVDGNGASVATTIKAKAKDGTESQVSGVYVPSVANHGDEVEIIYEAKIGSEVSEYKKSIPVYKTKASGKLDMTKYFITDNGGLEAKTSSMLLNVSTDTSFHFINSIYSTQAVVEFSTTTTMGNIGKFNIILTDYYDDNNQIMFSYVYTGSRLEFFVNGNENAKVPVTTNAKYGVTFDNLNSVVYYDATSNQVFAINKNLLGEDFNGFENNEFYLTFQFENVKAAASLELRTINGTTFCNTTSDYIGPAVAIAGESGGEKLINEEFVLPAALVYDVLDGKMDAYLTVYAPDGSPVTSTEGVVLDYLPITGNDIHKIKLTQFGDYQVLYNTKEDSFGNKTNKSYFIRVIDNTKPVITLESALPKTVTVGSNIHIPKAVVTDDKDSNLSWEVYIINPHGTIFQFNYTVGGTQQMGFVASEVGEYTIIYSARDTEGNLAVDVYTVVVKEA